MLADLLLNPAEILCSSMYKFNWCIDCANWRFFHWSWSRKWIIDDVPTVKMAAPTIMTTMLRQRSAVDAPAASPARPSSRS